MADPIGILGRRGMRVMIEMALPRAVVARQRWIRCKVFAQEVAKLGIGRQAAVKSFVINREKSMLKTGEQENRRRNEP